MNMNSYTCSAHYIQFVTVGEFLFIKTSLNAKTSATDCNRSKKQLATCSLGWDTMEGKDT